MNCESRGASDAVLGEKASRIGLDREWEYVF